MNRSALVVLLSAAVGSCVADPIIPDIWSLSETDASDKEVFPGGHYTLEACQRAGVEWFTQIRGETGVLQCRLNCRKMKKDDPPACEATEPVG
jgi:hypothetical protein